MVKQATNTPALLVRDKQELKGEILERIKKGELLLNLQITNEPEMKIAWQEFYSWNKVSYEIIASAFNAIHHKHEHQFVFRPPFDPYAIGYGNRPQKTFADLVEEVRMAVRSQLRKLQEFQEIIDVQQSVPGIVKSIAPKNDFKNLIELLNNFHKVAVKLRHRRAPRQSLEIINEYDVQYLLEGLLQVHFEDVMPEDHTPITAGSSSRIDFVLKEPKILLEVKMTNENLRDGVLGDELLADIGRYESYKGYKNLVIFIYDKDNFIRNRPSIKRDLESQSTPDFNITVVINP